MGRIGVKTRRDRSRHPHFARLPDSACADYFPVPPSAARPIPSTSTPPGAGAVAGGAAVDVALGGAKGAPAGAAGATVDIALGDGEGTAAGAAVAAALATSAVKATGAHRVCMIPPPHGVSLTKEGSQDEPVTHSTQ